MAASKLGKGFQVYFKLVLAIAIGLTCKQPGRRMKICSDIDRLTRHCNRSKTAGRGARYQKGLVNEACSGLWPVVLIVVVPVSRRATRAVVPVVVRVELIGSVVSVGFAGHVSCPFRDFGCYAVSTLIVTVASSHTLAGSWVTASWPN